MSIARRHLLTASALAMPGLAQAQAGELVIGFSHVATGPLQTLLSTNKVAVEMASTEINAAGGINGKRLRVSTFDTAGDPRQAQVAVRRFAEDEGAICVLGPASSGECRIAFPAGERLGIVQCSNSATAPGIIGGHRYAFRNTTDELTQVRRLLKVVQEKQLAAASASIIYATDEFASKTLGEQVFPTALREVGIPVTRSVGFANQAFDLSPQVAELMRTPTDLVALGGSGDAAIKVMAEMRRQGHQGRMIGSGVMSDPGLPEKMGPGGNGTLYPTFFFTELDERSRSFTARFAEGARAAGFQRLVPHHTDASAYDTLHILSEAMRRAEVTGGPASRARERTAVRDQLRQMESWNYSGVFGRLWFLEDGSSRLPAHIIEVRDGALHLLASRYED